MRSIRSVTSVILTVVFLAGISLVGGMTVAKSGGKLYDSARLMSKLDDYLPEEWNGLDLFAARVRSFENTFSEELWMSEEMGYLNSGFQIALKNQLINTGSAGMVRLTTGHLHDLVPLCDMTGCAEEITAVAAMTRDKYGAPFLFVYEQPTLYSDDMLPRGFDALDHLSENAAQLTDALREGGVDVIDSRDVLNASGKGVDELVYYTDQHWTSLAALLMAQNLAGEVNARYGAGLDAEALDPASFDSLTIPRLFLGKYGQRLGTSLIAPDDMTVYWPTYDTEITRYTLNNGKETTVAGSFRDSVIRWSELEPLAGKTWNKLAYRDYGLTEDMDIFTNETAPGITVLLFKDSYSAGIGAFLSLTSARVVSVDLRKGEHGAEYYLELYQPDVVIMAYSMRMMTEHEYDFFK